MTTQSLADHLAAIYEAPDDDEARSAFRVDSPDAAEWAMRKLAKANADASDVSRQASDEFDRIKLWLDREHGRISRDIAFFEGLLTNWHRRLCDAELAEVGGDWSKVRHKTRRLPSGEVSARQAPDSWAATDEPAFLAWARLNQPWLVRIKESVNLTEAKRFLLPYPQGETSVVEPNTGELVPGITVTPGEVHYSVKVEP